MSEPKKSIHDVLDSVLARAEAMPRGGNLESLLDQETGPLVKALYEEVVRRRQQAAETSADFPPSGMPALP